MSGLMLLDVTNTRQYFQSLTEGHSRSCTLWEDEYVRVMPAECDTIIRKTQAELFISSDLCGSNLLNQLLSIQVDQSPSEQTLGCPSSPHHPEQPLLSSAASPGARHGRREGIFLHPRLQGAGRRRLAASPRWQPCARSSFPRPKLEAERATRKSGESCLSRKREAASHSILLV